MMEGGPPHLLIVWNPSYAADAMDEHLAVLIDWAGRAQAGDADRDDICSHLYLTDYRSLYVAWVGEITAQHLPREQPEELDHMPSYYRDQFADFWFQLWDIRRLVADDTPAVIEELKRLRNTRYHDRPVSLYGGMVELPLIVTREDGASWFSDRDVLTGGRTLDLGLRNPAAHTRATTQDRVGEGRYEILGIRCEGIAARLGRARMRS